MRGGAPRAALRKPTRASRHLAERRTPSAGMPPFYYGVLPLELLALLLAPFCLAKETPPPAAAASPVNYEAMENVCDPVHMEAIYCYCDFLGRGEGETANCMINNGTRASDPVWDTFYHQPGLHRLTISAVGQNRLDAVPTRAFTYLQQLWTLELKNAGISTVHTDAFARSASVSDLVLFRNGIEKLERHAFRKLTNVSRLNLGENRLQAVGRHVFVDLPRLRQLYLDRNRIARVRSGAFAELSALRELELYGNALRSVSRGTFRGLSQLRRLDLHRNRLKVIGDRTFAELPELTELELGDNRLQHLSGGGLEGLPRLVRLVLRDNRLAELLPDTFRHTPRLFYLSLERNRLRTLGHSTFRPIVGNMNNVTMYFYSAENRLVCDCRLAWLARLRAHTSSAHVRTALDTTTCYPPGEEESGEDPEDGRGSGAQPARPPVRLLDLKTSELPCDGPLSEEPVTEGPRRPSLQHRHRQAARGSSRATEPARSSLTTGAPAPPPSGGAAAVNRDTAEGSSGGGARIGSAHSGLLLLAAVLATAK